jgi:hypothetical protein
MIRFPLIAVLALTMAGGLTSCTALAVSQQMHGGIRYTIFPDARDHRIEKGKNGSLMYDSPELTVVSANGQLKINGIDCGTVKKGDHVEITEECMVKVNGDYRGDVTTGARENSQRIKESQAKKEWVVK